MGELSASWNWIKLSNSINENEKIVEVSNAAQLMFIYGLCYASRNLTDGVVPRSIAHRKLVDLPSDKAKELAEELVGVGLWIEVDNGYNTPSYLEHQTSKEKILELRKKRSDAGRKGGLKAKRKQKVSKRQANANQNGSKSQAEIEVEEELERDKEITNVISTSEPSGSDTTRREVKHLCHLLADLILERDPKARVAPDGQNWQTACRRLIDLDGRTPDEIEQVIRWCQGDPFERSNVLCMSKLRTRFDQLYAKSQPSQGHRRTELEAWLEEGEAND